MADNKRGQHPNSKANLLKGMAMPKLMYTDGPSQRLANSILDEEVETDDGEKMTAREAILRQQLLQALDGDLRACQFLIELAGRNEQNASSIKTAVNPLEQLQELMLRSKVDDRRKKTN